MSEGIGSPLKKPVRYRVSERGGNQTVLATFEHNIFLVMLPISTDHVPEDNEYPIDQLSEGIR